MDYKETKAAVSTITYDKKEIEAQTDYQIYPVTWR